MKKIKLILGLILCLAIGTTYGQDRPIDKLDKLSQELSLTDEQVKQVEQIFLIQKEKIKALKSEFQEDRNQMRESFMAIHDETALKMKEILNEVQFSKYSEMSKHRKERGRRSHSERQKYGRKMDAERKAHRKELRDEMKAYHQENIDPVIRQQRLKLEKQISEEDKAVIDELRAKATARKKQQKEKMKARKDSMRRHKHDMKERQHKEKAKMKRDLHEGHAIEREKIEKLIEKYGGEIHSLQEEIQDQREIWDKDMKAIKEKHKEKYKKEQLDRTKVKKSMDHHAKEKKHDRDKMVRKFHHKKAAHFLLLNPYTETMSLEGEASSILRNIKLFPNPAKAQSNVRFELQEDGPVSIELRNDQGLLIKQILEPNLQKGDNEISIDLSGIQDGSYILIFRDKNGMVKTQKLTIAK